jgi:PmbA protein
MARPSKWYDQSARILEELDKHAQSYGADGVIALVAENITRFVQVRNGQFEEGTTEQESNLSVEVTLPSGQSSSFQLDFQPERFDIDDAKKLIESRIQSARYHPEDLYNHLPEPELLAATVCDESAFRTSNLLTNDEMVKQAKAAERAAMARKDEGMHSSLGAEMDSQIGRDMLYVSGGFLGVESQKACGIMLKAKAAYKDENGKTRFTLGGDGMNRVEYSALDDPQTLGDRVAGKALRMRHARPLGPEDARNNVAMVFENTMATAFWGPLLNALSGKTVANGQSFLQNDFGKAVFPESITVVNNPTLQKTLGYSSFSGQGLPKQRHVMIDKGVITNWFMPLYYARKMGVAPTSAPGNIFVEPSKDAPADINQLIADLDTGILVTGFNGGGMNTTQGEYTVGAMGIMIRNGQIAEPVRDFSLAHNDLRAMIATTQIARDQKCNDRLWTPATRVHGLDLTA